MGADEVEAKFTNLVQQVAPALDKLSGDVLQTGDVDAIARCAALIERCRGDLNDVLDTMKKSIPPLVPYSKAGGVEVEGLGWVRLTSGDNWRAYRKHDLRSRAVAVMADEPDLFINLQTGERFPPAVAIQRILDRFNAFFGLGNPKRTEWKKIGVDLSEYAEVTPGRVTVQLPGARE
jgi:hypothetical protein